MKQLLNYCFNTVNGKYPTAAYLYLMHFSILLCGFNTVNGKYPTAATLLQYKLFQLLYGFNTVNGKYPTAANGGTGSNALDDVSIP